MNWKIFFLSKACTLSLQSKTLDIPLIVQKEIQSIWQEEKQRFPELFNGQIFTVDQISPNQIIGHWTEYRFLLAQIRKPTLFPLLQIQSLAVNGLIHCPDGFVIGQRTPHSVYLPNYWQSPPAGSVEYRQDCKNLDFATQLYTEAEEELGMKQSDLQWNGVALASQHDSSYIIDVGILLNTDLPFTTIKHQWELNANQEYSQLICHPIHDAIPDNFLPTTRALIRSWHQMQ